MGRAPSFGTPQGSNAFFPPVRSLVLLNDGHGHFSIASQLPPKPFGPSANSLGMSFGDLNGDGKPDLVLANAPTDQSLTDPRLQVLFNNGDGSFRDETGTRLPGQHDNNRHWIAFPRLIDINGDGKLDLLTHFDGYPAAGSPVYLNNGSGDFTPINVHAFESGLHVRQRQATHNAA